VALWSAWVVVALLLSSAGGAMFALVVGGSALLLAAVPGVVPSSETSGDRRELLVITAMYVVVVGLMRLAFSVFTAADVTGLFLAFTAALAVGAAGPIGYVVWFCRASLRDLGVRTDNWAGGPAAAVPAHGPFSRLHGLATGRRLPPRRSNAASRKAGGVRCHREEPDGRRTGCKQRRSSRSAGS
jgi:hypothetical protein